MDDLISRQAAINRAVTITMFGRDIRVVGVSELESLPSAQPDLNEWCMDCKEYDKERYSCPRFNRVIREALKDAKPERKTGKWISTDDGWDGEYFVCSVCGCPWTLIEGSPEDNGMNFCPNCGAYMRGEQNG